MKSYVGIWKLVLLCFQSYDNANIWHLHVVLPFTEHFYYISHLNCIKTKINRKHNLLSFMLKFMNKYLFHQIRIGICNTLHLKSITNNFSNEWEQLELNPYSLLIVTWHCVYSLPNSYSHPIHIIPNPAWKKYWKTQERNQSIFKLASLKKSLMVIELMMLSICLEHFITGI